MVTGGTGYIGSRLVNRLVRDGWVVSVIVRENSSLNLLVASLQKLNCYTYDGSMNCMLNIMQIAKPDIVFHLAAVTLCEHAPDDVDAILDANVRFSTQLIEAMSRSAIKSFVNTETFWQHFSGADYNPVCLYAATKQAFRDILVYYIETGQFNAISLVLYDTYGPDDPRKKLLSFLMGAKETKTEIDMTSGEQIVDMTHVDDVVAAFLRAGQMLLDEQYEGFGTYSISSGQRMSVRRLVELFVNESGVSLQLNWGGRAYRLREVMDPWIGNSLPGWKPKFDLVTGIRQLLR
ncbi:NAD-dependent epimerase/dehydratase family protein [Methylomonas sp. MK1]|uniref:NAD-dependent epimerase/dehydratase family protein n=1 Tax=Methylomonas sp. MK1 TaxID=1131552 RepID=UPI001F2A7668|nr:NAD-dependent epimerase/dehydratase family protein [Methylomonas sp. MK1]